jgi:hypothetical protein
MRLARPNRSWLAPTLLGVTVLLVLPFAYYSLAKGVDGLDGRSDMQARFMAGAVASPAILFHMIAGALLTTLALLQPIAAIRDRWPRLHRWNGRLLIAAALATAAGGLIYIAAQGTIGGPGMSAGFALYGALMGLAAGMTWRTAGTPDIARHRRWGLRLVCLAIGSWLYRVQYGLWFAITGGWGSSTDDFTGPFDLFMFTGFFLPQLLLLELWLRTRVEPRTAGG